MERVPPFNPGDRIVRTGPTDYLMPGVVHGHHYTADRVFWCCEYYKWRVDLIEIKWKDAVRAGGTYCAGCANCNKTDTAWLASDFSKLDTSTHTAETLLEELSEPTCLKSFI